MPWDPQSQLVQGLYKNGKEANGRNREQVTLMLRARAAGTKFEDCPTVPHAGYLTSMTRTNSLSKLFLFYGTIEEKWLYLLPWLLWPTDSDRNCAVWHLGLAYMPVNNKILRQQLCHDWLRTNPLQKSEERTLSISIIVYSHVTPFECCGRKCVKFFYLCIWLLCYIPTIQNKCY